MPLAPLIKRKIQEIVKMSIPIEMITPSHGIIWRSDPSKIIKAYTDWSSNASKNKVVIVFDTMVGSTEKMARAIAEGVTSQGVVVKVLKLRAATRTEAVTEILDAKAVIVGSPTLNNGIFPTIGSFLTYTIGLKPKDKLWNFFGSYGWEGGEVKNMIEMSRKAGFQINEQSVEVKYIP